MLVLVCKHPLLLFPVLCCQSWCLSECRTLSAAVVGAASGVVSGSRVYQGVSGAHKQVPHSTWLDFLRSLVQ
jgi:hypothetical protein